MTEICMWKRVYEQNKLEDEKAREYCKDCNGYDVECSANYENHFKNLEERKWLN